MFEKLRNMAEAGNQRAAENLERERARGRELDAELEQATADVAAADERLANIDQEMAAKRQERLDVNTQKQAEADIRQEEHEAEMTAITERTAETEVATQAARERRLVSEARVAKLQAQLDAMN
jgi:chromosome segregation ATPase